MALVGCFSVGLLTNELRTCRHRSRSAARGNVGAMPPLLLACRCYCSECAPVHFPVCSSWRCLLFLLKAMVMLRCVGHGEPLVLQTYIRLSAHHLQRHLLHPAAASTHHLLLNTSNNHSPPLSHHRQHLPPRSNDQPQQPSPPAALTSLCGARVRGRCSKRNRQDPKKHF